VTLPLIVEPEQLQHHLGDPAIRIVDLCRYDTFLQQHVPNAAHVEYPRIVRHAPPVMGLLPDANSLGQVMSELGITPETHVVAYDDEGGGKACRFLWTLDCIGHRAYSLLNGGLHAWANEGFPRAVQPHAIEPSRYEARLTSEATCDLSYIAARLGDPSVTIVDCRSAGEYDGSVVRAARGGHIPGAIHFDWVFAMDQQRNLRLRSERELRALVAGRGIAPDKETIVYCQTHHRSAHTYIALKSIGFERVRGYPGSWSEWGNAPNTPVESG
jgi:thiosulfate/3-mercaptopyruvate sulfurtransferase